MTGAVNVQRHLERGGITAEDRDSGGVSGQILTLKLLSNWGDMDAIGLCGLEVCICHFRVCVCLCVCVWVSGFVCVCVCVHT